MSEEERKSAAASASLLIMARTNGAYASRRQHVDALSYRPPVCLCMPVLLVLVLVLDSGGHAREEPRHRSPGGHHQGQRERRGQRQFVRAVH